RVHDLTRRSIQYSMIERFEPDANILAVHVFRLSTDCRKFVAASFNSAALAIQQLPVDVPLFTEIQTPGHLAPPDGLDGRRGRLRRCVRRDYSIIDATTPAPTVR